MGEGRGVHTPPNLTLFVPYASTQHSNTPNTPNTPNTLIPHPQPRSQFFARGNNLADLCAKEGSQETAVNLLGLVGGYLFLALLSSETPFVVWTAFIFLTLLHVVANVRSDSQ